MRFLDSVTLATTKLRAHRLRTALTMAVSGILFGLLVAIILLVQGVFDSAKRFSGVGLGDRYLVSMTVQGENFFIGEHSDNPSVVARVESAHAELVAKKLAAAKKYGIEYNPKTDDPSPVTTNIEKNQKVIDMEMIDSTTVKTVEQEIQKEKSNNIDVDKPLKNYQSVKKLGDYSPLSPSNGNLRYMENGTEKSLDNRDKGMYDSFGIVPGDDPKNLYVLPQTLADPFINNQYYDPTSGELPVVLPYSDAEKLLKLKPLEENASPQDRRNRMQEVSSRISEVSVEFCYRNNASQLLLENAKSIAHEIEKNKNEKNYQKPSIIYNVPNETSCGGVSVQSDTRSAVQKKSDESQILFEKEIGTYAGEPEQQKLVFRAVGVSADYSSANQLSTVAGLVQGLLASPLGYSAWNIPAGMLAQAPDTVKPAGVFENENNAQHDFTYGKTELLEFDNSDEARHLLRSMTSTGAGWAMPFGSASLILEEARVFFEKVMLAVVLVVGLVATIILSGLVGRTIADSRRETAVFRSIGASRTNIASIYVVYAFLFSLRVAIFAFVLGLILAGIIHIIGTEPATIGAELAFVAIGKNIDFVLISFMNIYLPVLVGVIIAAGLLSVTIPLLRNVRRNPINDMRDE